MSLSLEEIAADERRLLLWYPCSSVFICGYIFLKGPVCQSSAPTDVLLHSLCFLLFHNHQRSSVFICGYFLPENLCQDVLTCFADTSGANHLVSSYQAIAIGHLIVYNERNQSRSSPGGSTLSRRELSNHRHLWIKSPHARRLRVEQLEDRRLLAVLTVQNNLDDTLANLGGDGELSLREAIEIANNPGTVIDGFVSNDEADEIVFESSMSGQTILLVDGELEITEELIIDASSLNERLTIDAQSDSRILNFSGITGNFTIASLTLKNGYVKGENVSTADSTYNGGAVRFLSDGTLTLTSSVLSSNITSGSTTKGGAIFSNSGDVVVASSSLTQNSSRVGGGIYSQTGQVSVFSSSLDENDAGIKTELGNVYLYDTAVRNSSGSGLDVGPVNVELIDSVISGSGLYGIDARSELVGGSITLSGSTISGNSGGIRTTSSHLTLHSSTVDGNGPSRGGIHTERGDIMLIDSVVSGNGRLEAGIGIYSKYGAITLEDSTVSDNFADASRLVGSGIFAKHGHVNLTNSTVIRNSGSMGGGIYAASGDVQLTRSVVAENTSSRSGGGIHSGRGAVVLYESTIRNNEISGGRAFGSGGGVSTNLGSVTVKDSQIVNNTSAADGGGISTNSGEITLTRSTVSGNLSARNGGGIFTFIGEARLYSSTVSSNTSQGNGGGIYSQYAGVVVTASSVIANHAASVRSSAFRGGGGIFSLRGTLNLMTSTVDGNSTDQKAGGVWTGGEVALAHSTISGNTSRLNGGGIYSISGSLTLVDSTLTGNTTSHPGSSGGGVYARYTQQTFIRSTISNNTTGNRGGGIFVRDTASNDLFDIHSSIIAGNLANDARDLIVDPDSVQLNFSLIGDTIGSKVATTNGLGNLFDVDPLLGLLGDNGGPTQTHALLPGSPAIDMGDPSFAHPPFYDQRGFNFARVVGGRIDIGAVEAGAMSADFDLDRDVDGADFLAWQRGYGADSATHLGGDANVDGVVHANDLAIWTQTYADRPATLADFDLDGDFDGTDFLTWQRGHGSMGASHSDGDANLDGVVDASDLAAWRVTYGGAAPGVRGQGSGASEGVLAILGAWELLHEVGDEDVAVVGETAAGEVATPLRANLGERSVVGGSRRAEYREVDSPHEAAATDEPWLSDELLERVFG